MLFAKYNAKDTTVTVNGVNITGFGEDMLSIEKDEEFFSTSVGAQGDVVKSENINSTISYIFLLNLLYLHPYEYLKDFHYP